MGTMSIFQVWGVHTWYSRSTDMIVVQQCRCRIISMFSSGCKTSWVSASLEQRACAILHRLYSMCFFGLQIRIAARTVGVTSLPLRGSTSHAYPPWAMRQALPSAQCDRNVRLRSRLPVAVAPRWPAGHDDRPDCWRRRLHSISDGKPAVPRTPFGPTSRMQCVSPQTMT